MKLLRYLPILFALVPALHAQTWFPLVTTESQTIYLTVPANSSLRWCDAATGKTCTPTYTASGTFKTYCPLVTQCTTTDASAGLSGVNKAVYILETSAVQKVTLTNAGVTPNTSTSISVPAIGPPPATSYPAISFVVGKSYSFTLANGPSGIMPQGILQFADGGNVVTMNCTYIGTQNIAASSTTTAGLKALVTCVAAAPAP